MGWMRNGRGRQEPARRVARLRAERDQILAELEVARAESAWHLASDDPFEIAEGRRWSETAEALEAALEAAEQALFRAELDAFGAS